MVRSFLLTLLIGVSLGALQGQSLLPTAQPHAVGLDPVRLDRVGQLVKRYVDEGQHAGASLMVLRYGRQIAWEQFGTKNIDDGSPIVQDTIFRIYSMSKVLTSVAVLQLLETGQLNLDDDVTRWLPELEQVKVYTAAPSANADEASQNPITVRMLLNHTAGFTYDFFEGSPVHDAYKAADLWNSPSLDAFIEKVGKLPLLSNPGTEFHYSIGLDVAGVLIERVSGEPFADYLRRHVTSPLGMKDTNFHVPADKRRRLASLHQHGTNGQLETANAILGAYADQGKGIPSGGGGLFSTITDYAHFAQMLLNQGKLDDVRILGRKTVELALANSLTETATPYNEFSLADGWGLLGAVRLDVGRSQELGSPGMFYWSGAATTHFFVDPSEKLIGLVFCQHVPFDEHNLFRPFRNAIYQALD